MVIGACVIDECCPKGFSFFGYTTTYKCKVPFLLVFNGIETFTVLKNKIHKNHIPYFFGYKTEFFPSKTI